VPEHNRWHPFDASCQAPELFRAFRKKLGKESEEVKKVEREGESWMGKMVGGGQGEDVEFTRGKTVLMIGDSTVREQVRSIVAPASLLPRTSLQRWSSTKTNGLT
jgi:hypothetical protein